VRPTIKNKLWGGCIGFVLLMVIVATISVWAVINLRRSALETARVGDRLNAISLEIQVHNLEAQRLAAAFVGSVNRIGLQEAKDEFLDEANFEVSSIQALAEKAVAIAPDAKKRAVFQRVSNAADKYAQTLEQVARAAELKTGNAISPDYDASVQELREAAEDGELAGKDASQSSQIAIERISGQAVPLVIGVCILAFVLAVAASVVMARAILIPVNHLREIAEKVSLGDLDIAVTHHCDDEMGELADSFSRMVSAVKFFRMESTDDERSHGAAGGAR
jgi:HAMP domain-containing protein